MMRNGQNKRMRGRNRNNNNNNSGHHHHNRGHHQNPLTRVYESNGPDVKIRGTAHHIAEKYLQLARDATSTGDHVTAEAHHQHAEHYLRLIAAAQEQFRQQNPHYQPPAAPTDNVGDGGADDGGDETSQPMPVAQGFNGQPNYQQQQPQQQQPQQQPQPYGGPQPYQGSQPQHQPQPQYGRPPQQHQPQPQYQPQQAPQPQPAGDVGGLPSFITGAPAQPPQYGGGNANGHDNQGGERDRFRRRRRHRGPNNPGQEMRGDAPTEPAGE